MNHFVQKSVILEKTTMGAFSNVNERLVAAFIVIATISHHHDDLWSGTTRVPLRRAASCGGRQLDFPGA
jgi:hypothetical protein